MCVLLCNLHMFTCNSADHHTPVLNLKPKCPVSQQLKWETHLSFSEAEDMENILCGCGFCSVWIAKHDGYAKGEKKERNVLVMWPRVSYGLPTDTICKEREWKKSVFSECCEGLRVLYISCYNFHNYTNVAYSLCKKAKRAPVNLKTIKPHRNITLRM